MKLNFETNNLNILGKSVRKMGFFLKMM